MGTKEDKGWLLASCLHAPASPRGEEVGKFMFLRCQGSFRSDHFLEKITMMLLYPLVFSILARLCPNGPPSPL